jgi:hypothetical protein
MDPWTIPSVSCGFPGDGRTIVDGSEDLQRLGIPFLGRGKGEQTKQAVICIDV